MDTPTLGLPAWVLSNANDLQVPLFAGSLLLFAALERIAPRRAAIERGRRWRGNWTLTILNVLALGLIPVSFVTAATWAGGEGIGLLNQVAIPDWAIALTTLILRGGISTGTHWLNHRVPWLWRIHRVHHLDTDLDVSSTVRFHPLEMLVGPVIGLPVVVALGLEPWALAAYELLDVAVTMFSHSNWRMAPGIDRWLRYLIVTPDLHRVHHSSWQPETDSNFGAVFPVWDLIFGTFRTISSERQATLESGLASPRGRETRSICWLLRSPFGLEGRH